MVLFRKPQFRKPQFTPPSEIPPSRWSESPAPLRACHQQAPSSEWVEYAFEKPATVSECRVYWFDDTGRGEVRVPASWRLLYRDGNGWKPVRARELYDVEQDTYNRVAFEPVTTSGLRLELTMQPNWSAGIQQWRAK